MLADQTMLDADARRELRAQAMLEKREAAKAKRRMEIGEKTAFTIDFLCGFAPLRLFFRWRVK